MSIYDIIIAYKAESVCFAVVLIIILARLISVKKIELNIWEIPKKVTKTLNADLYKNIEKISGHIETISLKVSDIKNQCLEDRKKNIRKSILRFADELRIGQKHSKEMFDTVLLEITEYMDICEQTQDANHVILQAIEIIKEKNKKCFDDNDYL